MIRLLLGLVLAVLLAATALLALYGIESAPLVEPPRQLSHDDIERIRLLLREHDPRRLTRQEDRTLVLTERDLNLLLQYAGPHLADTGGQLQLQPGSAQARLSVPLPGSPPAGYLNIRADFAATDETLRLERLSLGDLALPVWLLDPVLRQGHRLLLERNADYRTAIEAVRALRLEDQRLVLEYRLDPAVVSQLRQRGKGYLFPQADNQRMLAYQSELARLAGALGTRHTSLAGVLPALFQLAAERSSGGDAQAENRALILTLTLHALGMNPDRFFEVPQEMPVVPRLRLTLLGRHDLAQHYLVSAALAISGGSVLAAAIGEFKELDDSRRGTGFSFPDLLADRAGIRLAELATGSRQQARRLQQQLGAAQQEADFMPRIDDLPEGIMELEFKHRYRDLDSEAYRLVQDEIDRRLATCRVYAAANNGS